MSLAAALEQAAEALPAHADAIRPANGDPTRLLESLPDEGAVAVLGWLLAEEPEAGGELAESWLESPQGRSAVAALRPEALPKNGRKLLRRVLHQLRSRGVAVEEPQPRAGTATLPPVDDPFGGALVTPLDPVGARLAYVVEPHPSGGARMFELLLHDERGVIDLKVYSAGRSKVRSFLRELRQRPGGQGPCEIPTEQLRALVARTIAAQPADRPAPPAFAEWRTHLLGDGEPGATPGDLAEQALGPVAPDRSLLDAAVELVRQGRVAPWLPEPERLQQVAARLGEAGEGPIILSGAARRERLEEILVEDLEAIYGGAAAGRMAARWRESAYLLWRQGDDEAARHCLAAAAAFETKPPAENPVARMTLELPLASLLAEPPAEAEEAGEPDADASLLVKP